MQDGDNISEIKIENQKIIENTELNIWEALIPVFALVGMLAYNIYVYGDDALSGSNQFILLLGAAVAAIVGFKNKVSYKRMLEEVSENVKSTTGALLILLMVGALAGTWKVSGVIPAMVYYGINFIDPSVFLPLTLVITAIVSLTAGSSYITSATIGVALISVGNAFNIPPSMTAGAVISGAYFGDKMSPLSDTTNLASAISGADLYTHIKYMMYTTFPTFIITFITFCIITLNLNSSSSNDVIEIGMISEILKEDFYISPILFLIPTSVLILAYLKVKPVIALSLGVLFAIIFSIIFADIKEGVPPPK